MRLNPIVKKDLQVSARSMRLSWGVFLYEGVLTLAFLLALVVIQQESSYIYSSGNVYGYLVYMFPVIAIVQVCIVALITPIITASSISGEKERQTFDIMLTTCMSPFSIVLGKVISAVMRILFYVAAGMPIMAISFVVGGLSWLNLLYFLLAVILLAVFSGSVGVLCSALCRKSITAVIMSFGVYFVVYGLTFLPLFLKMIFGNGNGGESILPLLFNPAVFFEEFFMHILSDSAILGNTPFSKHDVGVITYYLTHGKVWMFVSAGCIVLMSVLFLLAAAWKVNPMHAISVKKRKKKKED
ncbi:MAG: ABC transporter permease subunit [Lachnospiraceae bacterium]|nr:ABC transporter permease subunit [Lachnospiraceae bacterium]